MPDPSVSRDGRGPGKPLGPLFSPTAGPGRCLSPEEGRRLLAERGRPRRKYRNQPATAEGMRFDSKREAAEWQRLELLRKAGEVRLLLRQVPLPVGAGAVLRVDFLVWYADGRLELRDAKGFRTQVWRLKKRLAEEILGMEILEV